MGGKYWREREREKNVKVKRERRVTGKRGGYEGENGGGKRTRVSFGLECFFSILFVRERKKVIVTCLSLSIVCCWIEF